MPHPEARAPLRVGAECEPIARLPIKPAAVRVMHARVVGALGLRGGSGKHGDEDAAWLAITAVGCAASRPPLLLAAKSSSAMKSLDVRAWRPRCTPRAVVACDRAHARRK